MNTTNTRADVAESVAGVVGGMNTNRVSALFDSRPHAEMAVNELRQMGIGESHLSVIARHDTDGMVSYNENDAGADVAKGTVAGMGVGALFGIAAALIPGVGPFITAGTLLTSALGAVGGGAVAGAVVGGTTGLIASALARAGYSEEEARHYGESIERGGTLVVVDAPGYSADQVRAILSRHGGRSAL
jgi:uncharacterized membrane protein